MTEPPLYIRHIAADTKQSVRDVAFLANTTMELAAVALIESVLGIPNEGQADVIKAVAIWKRAAKARADAAR